MIKLSWNPASFELDHTKPHILIASFFKSGFLLPAPGTCGTLAAVLPGLLMLWIGGPGLLLIAILALFAAGFWAIPKFEQDCNEKDPSMIVMDEAIGIWIVLMTAGFHPIMLILGIIFFRFFDIIKFWPASVFNAIKNPMGVMMDDVFAAFYASLLIVLIQGLTGF